MRKKVGYAKANHRIRTIYRNLSFILLAKILQTKPTTTITVSTTDILNYQPQQKR